MTKLPKQWKYWCRKANLRPHGKRQGRQGYVWCYLKGRGRVWRVNDKNAFQRGDTYEDFDRWALCDIKQYESIPQSEAEFLSVVSELSRP